MIEPAFTVVVTLAQAISIVEREIASEARETSDYQGDAYGWCRHHMGRMALLADRLVPLAGASIKSNSDAVRIRIAGVTATSTQGFTGALNNWLTAARKRAGQA